MKFQKSIYLGKQKNSTTSVDIADYDKDGDIDIIIGNSKQRNLLFSNQGNGKKFESIELSKNSYDTYDIKFMDLNGDGYPEIVESNSDEVNLFYLNTTNKNK